MFRYLHKLPSSFIVAIAGAVAVGAIASDAAAGLSPLRQAGQNVHVKAARAGEAATGAAAPSGKASPLTDIPGRSFRTSRPDPIRFDADVDGCFGREATATQPFLLQSVSLGASLRSDEDGASTFLRCWEGKLGQRDRGADEMVIAFNAAPDLSAGLGQDPGSAARSAAAAALAPAEDASAAPPLLIPLPPALWTGLGGFAGLGIVGVVRRSRRWMR